MKNKPIERLLCIFKKARKGYAEPELSLTWKQGVMAEICSAAIASSPSPYELFAPRVAVAAALMLVVLSVPCLVTVDSLVALLDVQQMDAVFDPSQYWFLL